jgi:hypothetical protein
LRGSPPFHNPETQTWKKKENKLKDKSVTLLTGWEKKIQNHSLRTAAAANKFRGMNEFFFYCNELLFKKRGNELKKINSMFTWAQIYIDLNSDSLVGEQATF